MPVNDTESRLRSLEYWQRDVAGELAEWRREFRKRGRRLNELERIVEKMAEDDRLKAALENVAATNRQLSAKTTRLHLSVWQMILATVVVATSVTGLILQAVK